MRHTVYGAGGFDPNLPNNNVVSDTEVDDPPEQDPPAHDRLAAIEDALLKSGNAKIIAALEADPRSPVKG